jgi:hypothetical protein
MRLIAVIAFAFVATSACSAVEHVGRPPSPDELARINAVTSNGRAVVVDYQNGQVPVVPLPQGSPEITLTLRGGAEANVPLVGVAGLTVTGHDRARGALIGATIGAGTELVALGLLVVALHGTPSDPDAPPMAEQGCGGKCSEIILLIAAEGALVGGIIGALVAAPHHFVFDGPQGRRNPDTGVVF